MPHQAHWSLLLLILATSCSILPQPDEYLTDSDGDIVGDVDGDTDADASTDGDSEGISSDSGCGCQAAGRGSADFVAALMRLISIRWVES